MSICANIIQFLNFNNGETATFVCMSDISDFIHRLVCIHQRKFRKLRKAN